MVSHRIKSYFLDATMSKRSKTTVEVVFLFLNQCIGEQSIQSKTESAGLTMNIAFPDEI